MFNLCVRACVGGGGGVWVGVTLGNLALGYVGAMSCSKARSSQITCYEALVPSVLV